MGAATRNKVRIRIVHEFVVERDFVVTTDVANTLHDDLSERGEQRVMMDLADEALEEPFHTVEVEYVSTPSACCPARPPGMSHVPENSDFSVCSFCGGATGQEGPAVLL